MPAAITDKFNLISNGSQPLPTQLSAQKNAGATTASLTAATGWDTSTAKHIRMYQTQVVNGQTVPNPSTISYYKATLSGTTLSNLTLIWSATGSDQQYPAGATVDLAPNAGWADDLTNNLLVAHDQDGTLKADAVDVTAVIKDAVITPQKLNSRTRLGWIDNELSAVSTVTHNGNRSYDVVFASTVASILSEGMRLEFTKATAGNAYMGGAFNGSSHYFTKTSPGGTLGTVTNNFTIEAVVQPTSYPAGNVYIAARADSTPSNGFGLFINNNGQLGVLVMSGGGANFRYFLTYQSLALNKKYHVAASWTSGTVVIYIDGVSVPIGTANTGGSAPTTAGTGGDFSIGRFGASGASYIPGYISNVGVFDAVLSASTIKDHYTKKLTGSETNCIGAWSLDNTANDQSSAGNNLTATGGVGYTAMSPHGQLGNGVETTKAVGLITNVNGTTVTVQCPEGVTIPSGSSTISSVAYSTQANPFGWVSDKNRWHLLSILNTSIGQASPTANTWYNIGSFKIDVPVGGWTAEYQVYGQANKSGAGVDVTTTLSTTTSTETDITATAAFSDSSSATSFSGNFLNTLIAQSIAIKNTSLTSHYLNAKCTNTGVLGIYISNGKSSTIRVVPSAL